MIGQAFEIEAADGTTIAVAPGDYYFNTKARCRRMMKNSLSSEGRQIYACLELATMGFQQELAVTMEGGKKRPLTPADIMRQTGLSKQHTRRGMAEVETAGLAERRSDDGGPLRNGHILLYSWGIPRAGYLEVQGSHRAATFPDWFPESWEPLKPLIKRLKLSINVDEVSARGYLEEIAEAARGYQNAEKVAIELLKRVCAPTKNPLLNKEEINEINIERNPSPPTPSHADAQEGNGVHEPVSQKPAKAETAGWGRFCELAATARMRLTPAEHPALKREFGKLSFEDQIGACRGIEIRLDSGEYDPVPEHPNFTPSAESYLRKQLWTTSLRQTRKKAAAAGDELLEQWAKEGS